MKKKLFLWVIYVVLSLLVINGSGCAFVVRATDLESRTNENVSDNEKKEDNPTEEVDNTNEAVMNNQLAINCNDITIEDIKKLKVFNKYGKTLTIGDEGKLIQSLHILLKWLNYDVDDTSTVFTQQTREAVIQFQEDHSMKGIGVVDKLTYIRLNDFIHSSKIEYDYIDYDVKMGPTEGYWIIINKTTNVLQLYKGKNRLNIYPIATGRYPSFTPEGKFEIANKLVNAAWKDVPGGVASNPLGSRWMGINAKNHWTYGIHGCGRPESIGTYASAGCIRMYNFQSEELYKIVPVHTPVWIGTTDKIEEWIAELNNVYDDIKKEQEVASIVIYEEVMTVLLKPYINRALNMYYGNAFYVPLRTRVMNVMKDEEQPHRVILLVEVTGNVKIDHEAMNEGNIDGHNAIDKPIRKDILTITIDLNTSRIEVYE